jgi:hypothetical protein
MPSGISLLDDFAHTTSGTRTNSTRFQMLIVTCSCHAFNTQIYQLLVMESTESDTVARQAPELEIWPGFVLLLKA